MGKPDPITTVFTAPSSCLQRYVVTLETGLTSLGQSDIPLISDPACFPYTSDSVEFGYYSPATCPGSWTTAGTKLRQYDGQELAPGESAFECCPPNYTLEPAYGRSCRSIINTPITATLILTDSAGKSISSTTNVLNPDSTIFGYCRHLQVRFQKSDTSKLNVGITFPAQESQYGPSRVVEPLQSLVTVFTPPASCANAFYADDFSVTDVKALYRANSDAMPQCYPTSFQYAYASVGYYSPAICPQGYTVACTPTESDNIGAATITGETVQLCCPSNYKCYDGKYTGSANEKYDYAFCSSTISKPTVMTLTSIEGTGFTGSIYADSTVTTVGGLGPVTVRAYGIQVRQRRQDTALFAQAATAQTTGRGSRVGSSTSEYYATSATSTSSEYSTGNSTDKKSSGLSTGAKIGLGVGIPLLFIFLGLILFFFLRRRKNRKLANAQDGDWMKPELDSAPPPPKDAKNQYIAELPGSKKHVNHTTDPSDPQSTTIINEKEKPTELPVTYHAVELDSNQTSPLSEIDSQSHTKPVPFPAEMDAHDKNTANDAVLPLSKISSIENSAVENLSPVEPIDVNTVKTTSSLYDKMSKNSGPYSETMAM